MDILQVHASYRYQGGEDVVVEQEARLLRSAGHDVRQHIVPNPQTAVRTVGALAASPWNPASFVAGRRLGRDHEPTVAHIHNTWYSLSPSIVSGLSRADVPVVTTLHNFRLSCVNGLLYRDGGPCTTCVGRSPMPGILYKCYRSSSALSAVAAAGIGLNRALGTWNEGVDQFVVMTEFSKHLNVSAGIPAERITVKPHFVPDPGERKRPPSESSTVLYVGRISEEKGLPTLLQAWANAAPPDLELVIVGEGPLREELEERSGNSVRFVGSLTREQVVTLMLEARAFLFPSQWFETFGLVVVEALSSGLPVVASDLGGNGELLADLGEDWLVDASDLGAWVMALGMLEDGTRVDSTGAKARASYLRKYSESAGLSNLERLYEQAASVRSSR